MARRPTDWKRIAYVVLAVVSALVGKTTYDYAEETHDKLRQSELSQMLGNG